MVSGGAHFGDGGAIAFKALLKNWHPPATPIQLLKKYTGYNKVAHLFGWQGKKKKTEELDEDLPMTFDRLLEINAVDMNIHEILDQVIENFPEMSEFYSENGPGTLHHFQQVSQFLNEMQEYIELEGEVETRRSLSLEDIDQIQKDNLFHYKNNLARAMNSKITVTTMGLHPLYSVNGEPIEKFPKTGADIRKLKGKRINKLLLALSLPTDGTLFERKQRFMKYIGFTMLLNF
ncbi:hypothetical protein HOY80DRAFT_1092009 [Tuber brumale]|nr:hypothetical protein HOY80DRAFT_1092009 [Tuber brumale]